MGFVNLFHCAGKGVRVLLDCEAYERHHARYQNGLVAHGVHEFAYQVVAFVVQLLSF